jgi:ATP-binding cassette subfamily F protein uup
MDKLVDHLFVFEGNGIVKDFNGNYTEYRNLKKSLPAEKTTINQNQKEKKQKIRSDKDQQKLTYLERKEFNRLEKEIEKHESRKSEIMEKFNDPNLPPDQIQELSNELGQINRDLEEKEMRWLELSELA